MRKLYISRHNKAVQTLMHHIARGTYGGCYKIMDATAEADHPEYVSGTRLPKWLLPNCPDHIRRKMRPDILLIPSLPLKPAHTPLPDSNRTVYIIEVGYCADTNHAAKTHEKAKQHAKLAKYLRRAGWKVKYKTQHAVSLGFAGTLRASLPKLLRKLGVSAGAATRCCNTLHDHAVTTLNDIVRTRRRAERGLPLTPMEAG